MAKEFTDRDRIAALEAQNQQLTSEIAELKKAGRPEPSHHQQVAAPIQEEGVRVSHPQSYSIIMPTTEQYEKLLNIVLRVYPMRCDQEFFRGFVGSFERIASLRRSASLNTAQGVQYWADEAYRFLQDRGTPAETTNGSYFAAVAASGDVDFSLARRDEGIIPYYALTFDTDARKISPGAWQRVLSDCQPRAPVAAPAPLRNNQRTAQVRIYG